MKFLVVVTPPSIYQDGTHTTPIHNGINFISAEIDVKMNLLTLDISKTRVNNNGDNIF